MFCFPEGINVLHLCAHLHVEILVLDEGNGICMTHKHFKRGNIFSFYNTKQQLKSLPETRSGKLQERANHFKRGGKTPSHE